MSPNLGIVLSVSDYTNASRHDCYNAFARGQFAPNEADAQLIMARECVVALDAGTTSVRAIAFDRNSLQPLHVCQREFGQHYPRDGWVEHDAEEIWTAAAAVLRQLGDFAAGRGIKVLALGIANQRETVLLWERDGGRPLHRAIVWQDRRTAETCARLREQGCEDEVRRVTGLLLDPYFSATKFSWLLEHTASRAQAAAGKVLAGTIDTFLLWRLSGGQAFATDVTNASRTMLFSLADLDWSEPMLAMHDVPRACLAKPLACTADFATTDIFGGDPVPISSLIGDQQAAAIGQACLDCGESKATYGTGCFLLSQGGSDPVVPGSGLLGTVGYQVADELRYAVEGSIFVAGSAIKWLRDRAGLLETAAASEQIAAGIASDGVYLVPAFAGLGAPHWQPQARAAIVGMSLDSDARRIVRAALEGVAFQTVDLAEAFAGCGLAISRLRVDGGMAANSLFVQMLADLLDLPVSRPRSPESTAAGAAFLAGLQAGCFASLDQMRSLWQADRSFEPALPAAERQRLLAGWQRAVAAVAGHAQN